MLLSGLMPETPLGKIVATRCEENKEILKHFSPEEIESGMTGEQTQPERGNDRGRDGESGIKPSRNISKSIWLMLYIKIGRRDWNVQ